MAQGQVTDGIAGVDGDEDLALGDEVLDYFRGFEVG